MDQILFLRNVEDETTGTHVVYGCAQAASGPALDWGTGCVETGNALWAAIGAGLELTVGRLEHDQALYGDLVARCQVPARDEQAEVGLPIRTLLLTLDIEKGEFVFLVGASGSGKSTFLKLCLKEERPSSGQIHVAGKDLNRLSRWKVPALRRQVGTVFQDFRLLPNKTVQQNVAFALEVIGRPTSQINKVVPEVLDLVGLEGKYDRMPDELSGSASPSPERSSTGR